MYTQLNLRIVFSFLLNGFVSMFCIKSHAFFTLLFRSRGFDIKWVDDTHALGVFASAVAGK